MKKTLAITALVIGALLMAAGTIRHFEGSGDDRFAFVTITTMAGAFIWALVYLFGGLLCKTAKPHAPSTQRPIFLRR